MKERSLQRVPMLLYHAIAEGSVAEEESAFYTVGPEAFARQMAYLAENGWRTVSLAQVGCWLAGAGTLPERALVLTFDDGDATQARVAAPILQAHGWRAIFFVTAGYVGRPGMMTWDDLRRLRAMGMEIGSHGLEHQWLTRVSEEVARRELVESKRRLEEEIGAAVGWFAFPGGAWHPRLEPWVAQAGYVGAATSEAGYVTLGQRPWALPRLVMRRGDSLERLAVIVAAAPGFLACERTGQLALRLVRGALGSRRYERMKRWLAR